MKIYSQDIRMTQYWDIGMLTKMGQSQKNLDLADSKLKCNTYHR